MRKFVWGILFTLLILALAGFGAALLGYMPTNANAVPPQLERRLAMTALDRSMERHAPRVMNPVPATDENLIEGMKIYTMNCAGCHGGLDRKPVDLGRSFYPPAPNLILNPPDDPEWHVYYVVRTGVRYTGMPAWEKVLPAPDLWKVTAFLTRMDKLPPAVQDYWKKSAGPEPPPENPDAHQEHK
jgi:thiosulfate dehydrogenase